jgi:lysophospholipid acyltransferase (LPLAT)-like uncharacterized protein
MKIRNPKLVAAAGWLASSFARALVRSQRTQIHCVGPDVGYGRPQHPERLLFAIWHENLLLPAAHLGGPDLAVLISAHADGQILGSLIRAKGMGLVCGSSTRGGVEAVRQILREDFPYRHVAVTPDGPRGPRRIIQPGIVYLASRTGMKIVCIGVGYRNPWRAKSWDRFAIPKPCGRAKMIFSEPFEVPPKLKSEELERYRVLLQFELDRIQASAEEWAKSNTLSIPATQAMS